MYRLALPPILTVFLLTWPTVDMPSRLVWEVVFAKAARTRGSYRSTWNIQTQRQELHISFPPYHAASCPACSRRLSHLHMTHWSSICTASRGSVAGDSSLASGEGVAARVQGSYSLYTFVLRGRYSCSGCCSESRIWLDPLN
jgi:hypothetical protein